MPKYTELRKKTRYKVVQEVVVRKKGNIPGLRINAPPTIKNMTEKIKFNLLF